jgi:hypothetical protein
MRNQLKLYLALIALALLSTSIFTVKLENKNKAQVELSTKVNEDGPEGPTDDVDCDDVLSQQGKTDEVTNGNSPTTPPEIDCTNSCTPAGQNVDHKWTKLSCITGGNLHKFHDLGVNSEGFIVLVGVDGKLYEYEWEEDKFNEIKGDYKINNLRHVDIGYDGLIYVVSLGGDTYYLTCKRYWVKLPGCAIDIGTGRGDEVAKIGCDDYCLDNTDDALCLIDREGERCLQPKSPHVYRLICKCKCKCCRRKCNLFVKFEFECPEDNDKGIDRKCYWLKYPSGPVYTYQLTSSGVTTTVIERCKFYRIDVNSNGYPVVAAECFNPLQPVAVSPPLYVIYQFIGGGFNYYSKLYDSANKIDDVCGDNLGNVFFVESGNVFAYVSPNSSLQIPYLGLVPAPNAKRISCGPYAQPTIIDDDCCVYTTSVIDDYNHK